MSEEKVTINVPVDAETNRILDELQQDWYNTSKKKGLVLDRIVQSYADDSGMEAKIDQILAAVTDESRPNQKQSHTIDAPIDASSSDKSWSEETLKLVEHLEQEDEVNPEEWSQEALEAGSGRGSSPYDPDDLITAILRLWGSADRDSVEAAHKIAGYGRSTIGRYAREYIKHDTIQVVDEDNLLEEVVELGIAEGKHRGRYKIGDNSKNTAKTAERKYEKEFGKSLKNNLEAELRIGSKNLLEEPNRPRVREDVGVIVTRVNSYDFAGYQTASRVLQAYDDEGLLDDELREYIRSNWRENHEAPV